MKIAVMGSGGVGGYFGARLVQAGCDVSFIARGTHPAAIKEHGLRVESKLGDIHLSSARVTDDPRTLEPVDLILFSVKLWDTEAPARSIAPLFGPDTGIVSFQNGVQKDDILKHICGEKAVMGGVVQLGRTVGVPTPVNRTVRDILARARRGSQAGLT